MKSVTITRVSTALLAMLIAALSTPLLAKNYIDLTECPKSVAECEGKRIWKDGSRYEGEFKFGLPDGYGTMVYPDGSTYEGEFKDGFRHGEGIQNNDDHSKYKGSFVNGFMQGHGVYSFPCGHQYVGNFFRDKMDGQGVMEFNNGTAYSGYWQTGKPHGVGKFLRADGSIITTSFNKGLRDGAGDITYEGNKLNGIWKKNKLEGTVTMQFSNGDQLECAWKKGKIMKQNCVYTFQSGETKNTSIDALLGNANTQTNTTLLIYLEAMELKVNGDIEFAKVRFTIAKRFLKTDHPLQHFIRTAMKSIK